MPPLQRPQNFRDAQLANRGHFCCTFDCGKYFNSRGEARNHNPCPGRLKCYTDLVAMSKEAGLPTPTAYLERLEEAATGRSTAKRYYKNGGGNSQRFFPTGPASSNGGGSGEHSQYPPVSQYGGSASSNGSEKDQPAQQHSMEHPYRPGGGMNGPNNNFSQEQEPPPVDMNGQQHSLNGNMPQHSPYQSTIMIAQNDIFSANHHNQQQPPPGSEHDRGGPPPPPGNTEQGTAAAIRESAEILDLDSNHLYQPPPLERHYFSGYGLPPMFGNGWGHPGVTPEHHQFSSHGHDPPPNHPGFGDPHQPIPPYPVHAQNPSPPLHHHVQPPPPPTSVYDMERQNPPPPFSSKPPPAPLDYPPSSQHVPPPPPVSVQNQMGSGLPGTISSVTVQFVKKPSVKGNLSSNPLQRPQNFRDAQLANRGIFACSFSCGEYFNSLKEARNHNPCPERYRCYADLVAMSREAGTATPTAYLERLEEAAATKQSTAKRYSKKLEEQANVDKSDWRRHIAELWVNEHRNLFFKGKEFK